MKKLFYIKVPLKKAIKGNTLTELFNNISTYIGWYK